MKSRRQKQRGSTLIEFVLVLPIGVALLVGACSMGVACLRNLQAGQLARDVLLLADSGVDFGSPGGKQKLIEQGTSLGLESGKAAVHLTRIVCESTGYRIEQKHSIGDTARWPSQLQDPSKAADLKPGETAWVAEVFGESGTVTTLVPETVKARSVL
ncbi:hypothetical protein F183_A43280 [Bryobacterales bacterium F-183]|nr:hypothetical protein F183_A43280 [Bryobacterales bacterium F-183]